MGPYVEVTEITTLNNIAQPTAMINSVQDSIKNVPYPNGFAVWITNYEGVFLPRQLPAHSCTSQV